MQLTTPHHIRSSRAVFQSRRQSFGTTAFRRTWVSQGCTKDKNNQREPHVWPGNSGGVPLRQRNKAFEDVCTAIASDLSREWRQTWYFAGQKKQLQPEIAELAVPSLSPALNSKNKTSAITFLEQRLGACFLDSDRSELILTPTFICRVIISLDMISPSVKWR